MTDARVSRLAVEALSDPQPDGRVSRLAVEALTDPQPDGRVSRLAVEALTDPRPDGRVSRLAVEVLAADPPPTGYAATVLADGPLGYWRLGEASGATLVDSSGNARDGAYTGVVTRVPGLLPGDANGAVSFNGTNNVATVNDAAWMRPNLMSAEVVFSPNAAMLAAGSHTLVARNGSSGAAFLIRVDAGKLLAAIVPTTGGFKIINSGTTLTAGSTYHVVLTYDGTTIRLYLNGSLDVSGAWTGSMIQTTGIPLSIGANSLGSEYGSGVIDEVAYYGTVLSPARVIAHAAAVTYPSSYGQAVLADDPLMYWPLGETSGTAVADASTHGRTGIHENGALPGQASLLVDGTGASAGYLSTGGDTFVGNGAWMNNAAMTVEARVQPDAGSLNPSDVRMVLGRDQTANRGFNLAITSDNKFQFAPMVGGTQRVLKGTTTVVAGTTYTVAVRYDGATVSLAVNGVVEASVAATGALATPTAVFAVGNVSLTASTAGYNFSGRIAHVSWYATALSDVRLAYRHQRAVSATPPPSYSAEVLTDTPVAYWRLGDRGTGLVAADSANVAAPSPLTYQPPVRSAPALLPGGDDAAVTFTDATSYAVTTTPGASLNALSGLVVSMEFWFRFIGTPGAGDHHFVGVKGTSADRLYVVWRTSDQRMHFGWNNGSYRDLSVIVGALTPGTTYHVVLTADGTNVRAYVNGTLTHTQAQNVVGGGILPGASTDRWVVGRDNDLTTAASTVAGVMDEVALYSTALSPARIAAHYYAAQNATGTATGTVTPTATTIIGGRVAETDTTRAGTVTNTRPVTTIPGGKVVETDTARAGGVTSPKAIPGGQDVETDTASAGTVSSPKTAPGGRAPETDTARAGGVTNVTGPRVIPGGQAPETDAARAGGAATTAAPTKIPGGRASETDAARAGRVSGQKVVSGGKDVETDTARAGSAISPPTVFDLLLLDEEDTFDSGQISSAGLPDRTHWWSYTPTEVVDLTFDLEDTVPVGWVPTVDPDTDVESAPPDVDAIVTLYTGTSVHSLAVLASGTSSVTPIGLAVGATYYVRASIPSGDADVLYQLSVGPAADTQLYLMDLEVLSGPLRGAPTAVVVQVMGGPADDTVTFKIDGVDVPGTWDLDPFGNLPPTSVAVPEATTKGEHVISVHSDSTDLAGEGTFTLSRNPYVELQTVGLDADPVDIPEANTSTGVRRWVLQDLMPGGLGSWVMDRNPTSMSSPEYQRTLFQEHTTAKDGQYHLSSVALQSFEWTFSGYVDTEFEQNQLLAYYALNRRFYVIDHRTRAWMVAWQRCEIVPRKRQRNDDSSFNDWAADYTVTALIYDQDPRVPR